MITDVKISDGNRRHLIDYITERKAKGKFTVIDFGGVVSAWTTNIIDALVDINVPKNLNPETVFFHGDVNDPKFMSKIIKHSKRHGKFDFAITSHMLEDIANPKYVCSVLSKVAKSGFVAVPSKYREFAVFEHPSLRYRGYIHHRWVFNIEDDEFVGYPKMSFLEYDRSYDALANMNPAVQDLSFYWKDSIPIKIVNNDYLGPDVASVIGYYRRLLV